MKRKFCITIILCWLTGICTAQFIMGISAGPVLSRHVHEYNDMRLETWDKRVYVLKAPECRALPLPSWSGGIWVNFRLSEKYSMEGGLNYLFAQSRQLLAYRSLSEADAEIWKYFFERLHYITMPVELKRTFKKTGIKAGAQLQYLLGGEVDYPILKPVFIGYKYYYYWPGSLTYKNNEIAYKRWSAALRASVSHLLRPNLEAEFAVSYGLTNAGGFPYRSTFLNVFSLSLKYAFNSAGK